MKEVADQITRFRDAHKVPLPVPPAYDADFISDQQYKAPGAAK